MSFQIMNIKKLFEKHGFEIISYKKLVENKLAIFLIIESELTKYIDSFVRNRFLKIFFKSYFMIVKIIFKFILKFLLPNRVFDKLYINNNLILLKK